MSKKSELNFENEGPVKKKGTINSSSEAGLLGKFFGGVENAPTSICGVVVVLLITIGAAISFFDTKVDPVDFWKSIVLPTVTALFGYLFGKKR